MRRGWEVVGVGLSGGVMVVSDVEGEGRGRVR